MISTNHLQSYLLKMQKNVDLHNPLVCEMILNYVQSMQLPRYVEPKPVTHEALEIIKKNNYVVMPVHDGTPIWICWFQRSDIYYAVVFPKYFKTNVYNTKIFPMRMKFSKSFYNGSIMEGTYYQDGVSTIIIDDVFYLAGQRMVSMTREIRLNKALLALQNNSMVIDDTWRMSITKCYQIDKFSLTNLFNRIRDNDAIKQLRFCPNSTGTQVYDYIIAPNDKIEYIIKKGVFDMQKVTSDVYHLFYLDSNERIGIAYIPDLETSKKCASWFTKPGKLRVSCLFDSAVQKYIPVDLCQ